MGIADKGSGIKASDVLDVGCGRGEFLALLPEHGISARGIDVNPAMVDVCRAHGLDAVTADALPTSRRARTDHLGGCLRRRSSSTSQTALPDAVARRGVRQTAAGAPIVLETINPACWFAFFESYIRDLTHVRPVHPDTLKYLLIASGFQHVEIRYRAPYPESDKLQALERSRQPALRIWSRR